MQLPPYLPITSDYGFKVTFGNPDNTEFLRRALQALIRSEVPIAEVTFDRQAFEGLTAESRSGIYDLSCVDERGRHFLVEMQVARTPHFLQRLKFYAFHRLNALVGRGPFNWGSLPPIYCIALMSRSLLPGPDYHTIANLRSEAGELLDSQLTFVLVELEKFRLAAAEIHTDLEKLLFTMQTLDSDVLDLSMYPNIWEEKWLRVAIDELSTRNLSPAQREQFARLIAHRMDLETERAEREEQEAKIQQLTTDKQRIETEIQEAEAAKQQAEAEKQQAEAEKQQAEAEKQQAEAEKQQAEAEKQQAEAEKQQAEAEKQQAEAVAQDADAARQRAEAEAQRALTEQHRQQEATIGRLLRLGQLTPPAIADVLGVALAEVLRVQRQAEAGE